MSKIDSKNIKIYLGKNLISCRVWGDIKNKPVLALHGWMDNLSSFDLLIPELYKNRKDLCFIAIDFPGHGFSSHFKEADSGYYFTNFIIIVDELIKYLRKEFNYDKFILLGHSMGAAIGTTLAAIRPDYFSLLINIDCLGFYSNGSSKSVLNFQKFLDERKKFSDNNEKPYYKNLETLVRARALVGKIKRESAYLIIKRNVKKTKKGYTWRSDKYLQLASPVQLTEEQIINFLENVKQEMFLIIANIPIFTEAKNILLSRIKYVKNIDYVECDAGHHLHLDEPVFTGELILKWLDKKIN